MCKKSTQPPCDASSGTRSVRAAHRATEREGGDDDDDDDDGMGRRSARAVVVGACVLAMKWPTVRSEFPRDLSNFQGKHACSSEVRMARPVSLRDCSESVASADKVRANGAGHSWNPGLFCSSDGDDGVNVDASGVRSVSASSRFWLDEGGGFVRADAGMTTRALLDGLAERGYTLPAFPWFIDQTIGGAVATATHGSSLRWGSLSSQLVACTVVKADGSIDRYDETTTSKSLFNALRASVGRLGVIVDVTLRVVPNSQVRRQNVDVTPDEFVDEMFRVQNAVRACEQTHSDIDAAWSCAMEKKDILALDESQFFWYIPLREMSKITFRRDATYETSKRYDARRLSPEMSSVSLGLLTRHGEAETQPPSSPRDITRSVTLMAVDSAAPSWARQWKRATTSNIVDVIDERRDSYLTMTERQYDMHQVYGYEQCEVAVPLSKAGTCMRAFKDALYGDQQLDSGFRSQALIRFLKPESAWLSPAHGRVGTLYINIEDFVTYSRVSNRRGNAKFEDALRVLRGSECDGRLHWGKYGFPKRVGCFDGTKEYGLSFCHFACSARRMDPTGKFSGAADFLQFSGINFKDCCVDGLFVEKNGCVCASTRRARESNCSPREL